MPRDAKIATADDICQIRVSLMGLEPPIWRRLLVPADMNLKQLHQVLQVAMGWEDYHMHDFRIGKQRFGEPDPMERYLVGCRTYSEVSARLCEFLGRKGAKAIYVYDFGDEWHHQIVVEKVLAREPDGVYPRCLDGERHGPPEDCGGIAGYFNILESYFGTDPGEREAAMEWIGEGFDPQAFSIEDVNRKLARLQRRRRKAASGD